MTKQPTLKTKATLWQFVRYILVGVLNTAFGYGVFALLSWFGLHYAFALLAATIVGVLFNFKTYGKFVFSNTNNRLLFRFVVVYCIQYGLNVLLTKLLLMTGLIVYAAGAISIIIVTIITFFLNKRFVFIVRNK